MTLLSKAEDTAPCLNLFFAGWTLNTRWKFVGAVVAVFCFAVAVEGLAKVRHGTVRIVIQNGRTPTTTHHTTTATSLAASASTSSQRRLLLLLLRYCIPPLHGLQALTGYALMLVTMTFSVELLAAVVLGLAVGYAVFFGVTDGDVQHVTANPCCEFMQEETRESLLFGMTEESSAGLLSREEEDHGGSQNTTV